MPDPLITFADAAKLVGPGVTARHLRTWHERGFLRAIKVGRVWRTTAAEIEEAIARQWPSSSFTAQIASMDPNPSPACDDISGTSRGTKDEAAKSVARAWNTAAKIARKERLRNLPSLGMTRAINGQVVPYSRTK